MAAFVKFDSFVEALAEKKHNLGSDTLKLALCAAANAPVAGNTVLVDLTEISYTNCSARTVTISASSQTSGVYKLVASDLVLTASGGSVGPFRYIVLWNDTAANDELIGYWDYGSDLTLADTETFTWDADGSTGILTLT